MHIVYRISGPECTHTYYGYCPHDEVSPLDHFLIGATRSDDRNDVRFLAEHGNDATLLVASVVKVVEDEWEAHLLRNEHRAADIHSFTGPTHWPPGAQERALQENPDRMLAADQKWKVRNMPTARDAYVAGMWTMNDIRYLSMTHTKDVIIAELDKLTPREFTIKYVEPLQQQ